MAWTGNLRYKDTIRVLGRINNREGSRIRARNNFVFRRAESKTGTLSSSILLLVSPLQNEKEEVAGSPKGRPWGLRPSKGPWLTTLRVHRRARYTLGALQLIIPRDFAPI